MNDLKKVIVIRYSEIFLKGKNFAYFEKKLLSNIAEKLEGLAEVKRTNKRFLVENFDEKKEKKIIEILKTVFGICSISVAVMLDTDLKAIDDYVASLKIKSNTFRVTVNRADKRFPLTSIDYSKSLGGLVLKSNPHLKVDLHNPEVTIYVDIRESG